MPHGHCYRWEPGLVWLHVGADVLITLAYYSIPLTLLTFTRRRRDLPHLWIPALFSGFIIACGTTHLMEVWNIWHGNYWWSGVIKATTALLSVFTAVRLVKWMPVALQLRGPEELRRLNAELESRARDRADELTRINATLENEISERKRAEDQVRRLNSDLEHRVKELQAVLDVLPVGVGIARDRECRDIRMNRALAKMLDLSEAPTSNASKSAPPARPPRISLF